MFTWSYQADKKTYGKLYPSASHPGLFFGLAKVHKVKDNSNNVNDLPLRPIISNIGTATYETSKFLAGFLSPLAKNRYTINNTQDFVKRLNRLSIQTGEKMVSFDVSSLFTNVPLDFTIDVILKKIYEEKLVKTKLKRDQLKELLELCTKRLHFSFNGEIFQQTDGVAMGSPLGPVIANIFMSELENELVPTLNDKMHVWLRYVDDTFTIIKEDEIENIKGILNNYHASIKFTHEIEDGGNLPFLDVNVTRNLDGFFSTSVYRKQTDTNIYVHWEAYAPKIWKIGTLKGLFRRAFLVSSDENRLKLEIDFLKQVFVKINKYPKKVVDNTLKLVKEKIAKENERSIQTGDSNSCNQVTASSNVSIDYVHPHIILPYKGSKGVALIKSFKKCLSENLPVNVIPRFIFKGKKLGSFFPIKDKISIKHLSGIIYGFNVPVLDDDKYHYIGENKVRHETRTYQHTYTDKNSAIYQHSHEQNYTADPSNFTILAKGYPIWIDRRICEALFVKDHKPFLNRQKQSHKLELFV